MTTYALRNASPAKSRADVVVVGVLSGAPAGGKRRGKADRGPAAPQVHEAGRDVADAYGRRWAPLLSALGVTGKAGEVTRVPTGGSGSGLGTPLLVLVGLGAEVTPAAVRAAAGVAARSASNAASVALALPADSPELVAAVTEGHLLGGYAFTSYKSTPGTASKEAEVVVLSPVARRAEAQTAFEQAQVLAAAVAATRDWVNTPPNDLTPPLFADAVEAAVRAYEKQRSRGETKVSVTVRDEAELAELGCGGLLGVGGGSAAPPRLVELRYAPKGATAHLALVGKGITFDSGGLTIKPGPSMGEMKSDMAGAAAVVQVTLAIARLGLPVRVTAYAAMAENMLGGSAMRPGDVITQYGGTTVEVLNTDAEGRLVLADALVMATEQRPDLVVDVATLTGHMAATLGDQITGVMGTPDVVPLVVEAGRAVGETMWEMPIPEAIVDRVHGSKVADLAQHDWVRWGGGLLAGAFLREFTAGLPWAHLDIAGPAFTSGGPRGHLTGGATGVAVATLVELARRVADGALVAEAAAAG